MTNAYVVVQEFERRVADRFGMAHGLAVDCCTNAIFLSIKYRQACGFECLHATIPSKTYISVPFALKSAGLEVRFRQEHWGTFYRVDPWFVWDAAKHWAHPELVEYADPDKRGLWCLSFHVKKPIPIGRGGMILTNDDKAAEWLRRARYDGRSGIPYEQENIAELGYHMYITPEQAARGLSLMDVHPEGVQIEREDYPDLTKMRVFG